MIIEQEILSDLYFNKLLSIEKIAQELNCSYKQVVKNLKNYNFKRDTTSVRLKTYFENKPEEKPVCTKEFLEEVYINQNTPYNEMLKILNISSYKFDKLLKENNIHKDRKVSSSLVLESKYNQYGGKEYYDKYVDSKTKEKHIKDYGSLENYYNSLSISCKNSWLKKSPQEVKTINQARSNTCLEKYGLPWYCMTKECRSSSSNDSQPNRDFEDLLIKNQLSYEKEYTLSGYSYDFKINNTLIEINPTPTHNSTWSPFGDHKGIDKKYHYNKTKTANENGFNCINIWDWDDVSKVISLLKKRDRIFARQCIVKEINDKESIDFLNTYHLQNYVKSDICLALIYNNELVSIMSFGQPRYNKNFQYELLRYCSSKQIVGGAEKLFNYFIKKYNPISIVSYCDRSKFSGKVYNQLGFSSKSISISKHWFNLKTGKHITNNLLLQKGFDQLFQTNYGKTFSNEELMLANDFVEVFDCGQQTFIY